MADFDKVIDKLTDFTKTATTVVENKTKEAKLSYTLKKLEARVNDQFSAIGASLYLSFKEGTEPEDFSELFGRIDANEEIEELRERIKKVKYDE